MPPKLSVIVPPPAPGSPDEPDNRSDSPPDAEAPTLIHEEYDALVNSYQETLQRVQALGAALQAAHHSSSHTSLGPGEHVHDVTPALLELAHQSFYPDPKVDAPPEFHGKIS